jgi:shikimate kinase
MNHGMAPDEPALSSTGSIVLIGFRGSGKSTVGRILAGRLHKTFLDTDEIVTRSAGMNIKEIFESGGEPLFRGFEAAAVKEAVGVSDAVISTGGGVVLSDENVQHLRGCGVVIWLDAPAEVLWQRISADTATGASRPNLTAFGGLKEVVELLAHRRELYARAAHLVVHADDLPEQIAEKILSQISVL